MRQILTVVALVVVALVWPGASSAGDPPAAPAPVRGLIEAFNDHDPGRMSGWVTEDFELYYVTEGKAELATAGPEQLAVEMTNYFRALPTVRSEIVSFVDGTRFFSFRERVSWTDGEIERIQSSIAVYELEGERIRRVWYFPAEGS